MLKSKKSKQIISVIAQIIFVVGILLLAIASTVVVLNIFVNIAYGAYTDLDHGDDIFGNAVWGWFAIVMAVFVVPHFVSLLVLLHSGLYSLQLTPFSKAKCLHYISSGMALIIVLSYGLLYGASISHIIPNNFFGDYFDMLFMIAYFALFVSIILDIIGTILHKRDQKRQLESVDSQKTA